MRAPEAPACAPSGELTMLVVDSKLARVQSLRQGTPPWPRPNHVTLQIAPLGATEFAGAHFLSPSRGMLRICSLRATDFAGARFVTSHDVTQQVASLEAADFAGAHFVLSPRGMLQTCPLRATDLDLDLGLGLGLVEFGEAKIVAHRCGDNSKALPSTDAS